MAPAVLSGNTPLNQFDVLGLGVGVTDQYFVGFIDKSPATTGVNMGLDDLCNVQAVSQCFRASGLVCLLSYHLGVVAAASRSIGTWATPRSPRRCALGPLPAPLPWHN